MNGSLKLSTNTMSRTSDQKSKDFQMEILMEKLRSRTSQYKTLVDTSKAVRMTMLDKRWALDSADKSVLQKCLDNLQHCIKVTSLQSLIERLECLSRQLGLKFVVDTSGVDLFISSDMFYLEILLETTGAVKDVKIHHEGKIEQQSCEELVSCISRGDFADFTVQLEGLIAIYQLNAEKKMKSKSFSALQSLETDLLSLGQLQAFIKDPWAQVHKSPIGFLQKRRGGHAMRLTYFVSPYELLDKEKGLQPLTIELLSGAPSSANGPSKQPIGHYATVLLEGSTAHKLQITPIISVAPRPIVKSGPTYAPLCVQNSWMLPACFVLRLPRPMALCSGIAQIIRSTTEVEFGGDWTNTSPLLGLIAKHAFNQYSKGKNVEMDLSRGLFVTLPDQAQCYFLTECKSLSGTLISNVPFTHPSHVPALISCLRQQALFNTLIASCIRPNSKQDLESMIMFEVSALSWQHISISLEHPIEENMATVEIDLSDISSPRVMIYTSSSTTSTLEPLNEYISRVLQKSHSIPITLRSLVKFWEREAATKHMNGGYSSLDNSNFSMGLGGLDPGGPDIKQENGMGGQLGGNRTMYPSNVNHPHQGAYLSDMQHNLSLIATQDCSSQNVPANHPLSIPDVQQNFSREKKKSKKRKSEDVNPWSNKKIKPGYSQVVFESSSSVSESSEISDIEEDENMENSNSSNDEVDERADSPASQIEFASDLELSTLDANELIGGSSNDHHMSGSDMENSGDGELNDLQDVEDMIRNSAYSKSSEHRKKHKSRDSSESKNKMSSTNSLLLDLPDNKYMPPSVSITPINSGNVTPTTPSSTSTTPPNFSSMLCLDRRPGIEIIPISSTPPAALPSSITITPITSSQAKSMEERHRSEKKSSSSSKSSQSGTSERSKDKKKKKKREDPMGPPDKLPPKQDPLSKPVSVSIKPTDGSPLSMCSGSPNSLLRKFSPSPTHGRSVSITKSSSPSSMKSIGKPSGSSSHHSSPRSSPIQSSPKHLSGYSSPKNHGTSSPKHSSSSSGKPSMSTLKSAASGSPSGKSSSSYELAKFSKISSIKDNYGSSSSSKEKDRKSAQSGISFTNSGSCSPKLKSSSVKLKQLDLSSNPTVELQAPNTCENLLTQGVDINKSTVTNQARNRKGSLSAVIDKLKSAQYCGNETELSVTKTSSSSNNNINKDRISSSFNKITDSKNSSSSGGLKLSDTKNQEYMVKPSSDGMKITINKTRSKDSNSNSNTSKSSFSGSSNTSNSTLKQSPSPLYQSSSNPAAGSLKTHTGLKPGVISGPASKKPQVLQSSKSGSTLNSSPQSNNSTNLMVKNSSSSITNANSPKTSYTKSNSNSSVNSSITKSLSSKSSSTGSPKMSGSSDVSKLIRDRDKSRSSKSGSSSSSNDKSIFSSKSGERRSSPAPTKDEVDGERSLKLLNQHPKESNFLVEGLIKSLDTSKFQIPKLSARNVDDSTKMKSQLNMDKNNFQNMSQHGDSRLNQTDASPKLLDFIGRQDHLNSKYSFQQLANAKWVDAMAKSIPVNMSQSLSKPLLNMDTANPKLTLPPSKLMDDMQPANLTFSAITKNQMDFQKENAKGDPKSFDSTKLCSMVSNLSGKEDFGNSKLDGPLTPTKQYPSISVCSAETINQNIAKQLEAAANKGYSSTQGKNSMDDIRKSLNLSADLSMKPPSSTGILKGGSTTTQEAAEMLLDFSSSNSKSEHKSKLPSVAERTISSVPLRRNAPPLSAFSPSPSVSVHIVKSPVPSPLIIPSPHSNSPCITDDELMDEALVGPGK